MATTLSTHSAPHNYVTERNGTGLCRDWAPPTRALTGETEADLSALVRPSQPRYRALSFKAAQKLDSVPSLSDSQSNPCQGDYQEVLATV